MTPVPQPLKGPRAKEAYSHPPPPMWLTAAKASPRRWSPATRSPQLWPNSYGVTGGVHLADVAGALVSRMAPGASTTDLLAPALAPLVSSYDVAVVDTPPVDTTLQFLDPRLQRIGA